MFYQKPRISPLPILFDYNPADKYLLFAYSGCSIAFVLAYLINSNDFPSFW